jgi:hypothetical protein
MNRLTGNIAALIAMSALTAGCARNPTMISMRAVNGAHDCIETQTDTYCESMKDTLVPFEGENVRVRTINRMNQVTGKPPEYFTTEDVLGVNVACPAELNYDGNVCFIPLSQRDLGKLSEQRNKNY